jgi:hypothetical protein
VRAWLWIPWGAFLLFATVLAPSELPSDVLEMSKRLTLFDWPEPALTGLWYATGTLLFLHATFYFAERPQHVPHSLLVLIVSPLLGALVMLPYYALRRPHPTREPWRLPWRLLRVVLALEFVGFLAYGAIAGDVGALWDEITHRRFSAFLIVDCVILLALLFVHRHQTESS